MRFLRTAQRVAEPVADCLVEEESGGQAADPSIASDGTEERLHGKVELAGLRELWAETLGDSEDLHRHLGWPGRSITPQPGLRQAHAARHPRARGG